MQLAWHVLLALVSFRAVTCEDPQSEGFSSTSLLDLSTSLSHPESPDSAERASDDFPEADFRRALLHLPQGSGYSSQETEEEVAIFQSPKYFWEDEKEKVNSSQEDRSEKRTDDSQTTGTYAITKEEMKNSSSSSSQTPETSTTWLVTDTDETPKQLAPASKVLAEDDTAPTTAQHDRMAPFPNMEERTIPKMTSPSPTGPTTRPPRKTKKHSAPRSHHVHHEPGADHWPGPPADSRGQPAAASPGGQRHNEEHNEEQSSSTQSMLITKKMEKVHVPQILSTQRDEQQRKVIVSTELSLGSEQVICKDWIHLAGKNYVILNMSNDIDCEEFRWQKGQQLLSLLEGALSWKSEPPQRDWVIFLSKPNENDNHLLMTVTEEERVLPVRDVFTALEDIKRSLAEIGIESYSSTVSCQSHPSPQRSDYGTLFIVLVIIGAICVMIIVAGLIYICCQRRMPKMNMELHFVENGCHDNPTLDVAMDGQSEMQEKKPSLNGDTSHRADGWETLINKADKDEADAMEEDTHL